MPPSILEWREAPKNEMTVKENYFKSQSGTPLLGVHAVTNGGVVVFFRETPIPTDCKDGGYVFQTNTRGYERLVFKRSGGVWYFSEVELPEYYTDETPSEKNRVLDFPYLPLVYKANYVLRGLGQWWLELQDVTVKNEESKIRCVDETTVLI